MWRRKRSNLFIKKGYNVTAVDYSINAINMCNKLTDNKYLNNFRQLDILKDELNIKYDFIYSIAVIHMFVLPEHRNKYWQFIKEHLNKNGIAFVVSMGDGTNNFESDINTSFDSVERNAEDIKNTGAYFVHKTDENPDVVLISSGFTVGNAVIAAKQLKTEYNISASVINVVNLKQFAEYAPKLIVNNSPILTIYNGNPLTLSQIVSNAIIANPSIPRPKAFMSHGFEGGTTGKFEDLTKYYGFDSESIATKTLKLIKK